MLSTRNAIPGFHAEVQAVNRLLNRFPELNINDISTSTFRLDSSGVAFPTCRNCGNIINDSNILTVSVLDNDIKGSALSVIAGLYYYKGKPFDVVALTVLDSVVTEKTIYKLGHRVGEYISPYFPFNKDGLHIKTKNFTPAREEPYLYKEKLLSIVDIMAPLPSIRF